MQQLDRALAILDELIAYPTVSANSNLDLIAYVQQQLEELGAHCQVQKNSEQTKANIFATIGPERDGGIVLSGHTDVVPVAGQDWETDPFMAERKNARTYGRGSCDMKGFIAAALATAPDFATLAKSGKLSKPIHYAFTYDEEVGCLGAQALVASLAKQAVKPALAIVGEPTSMAIVNAHKSCCDYTTTFTGVPGHASLPHKGVNAIHYAVRFIQKIFEISEGFIGNRSPSSSFDPPNSTIQVGKIDGGIAHNVIPHKCKVDWEMRTIQPEERDKAKQALLDYVQRELLPQMQKEHREAKIETKVIAEVEGLIEMADNQAVELLQTLCGEQSPQVVSFGTEAGLFQHIGIDTVVCGPGSIEQAHKANEYIEHSQMHKALEMLTGLKPRL